MIIWNNNCNTRFPGVTGKQEGKSKKALALLKVKTEKYSCLCNVLYLKTFTRPIKILSKLPLTPETERL
jgi:hypothetical protein